MAAPTPVNPTPLRNSYWVLPGKVLAGEHPGGTNREATRERLQRLLTAGVECFIDLTEPGELKAYDTELPFTIEYLRKPIHDHDVPEKKAHMAEILDCVHDAVQSGRCVYIHCRAGIGRTGTVVGCFLVERGLDGEAALDELNRLWQHSERSQSWGSVPETDEQVDFVRKWKGRKGAAEPGGSAARGQSVSGGGKGGAKGPAAVGGKPGTQPGANAVSAAELVAGLEAAGDSKPTRSGDPYNSVEPAAAAAATSTHDVWLPKLSTSDDPGDELDPLLDAEAMAAVSRLRARFMGALLGLATGDAVAAHTQFRRPGTFTPVGDMLGGGPFDLPRGAWTDDTSMALCLAESLLEKNGFDARDQMERYRQWQQEGRLSATGQCVGITASTARAIAMAQWRRQAFSGSHDPSQMDPEPLSRVAPAVLFFFASSGQAVDQATEAARTTCQSPAVLEACRALARALYAALTGQPKAAVLEKAALGAPAGGGTGGAVAALSAAVAAFGATANFRDAILYAANLGGDSDVIASATGQLAGAYYGVKAIPTNWHNSLMQKELITGYVDRLLAHAMLGLSG